MPDIKRPVSSVLESKLTGPISDLSFLQRSLLFAETSMISYLSLEECNIAAGKLGFVDGKFFNSTGTQAYWYETKHDSVVVCRGTEVDDWNDLRPMPMRSPRLPKRLGG